MSEREAALKTAQEYLSMPAAFWARTLPGESDILAASVASLILAQRREAKIEALKWAQRSSYLPVSIVVDAEIARLEREKATIIFEAAREKKP